MFYGRENDMMLSNRFWNAVRKETEGYFLSKVICEYCGTMYTSEEGECPVCGHIDTPEAAQPGQEPAEKNAGEATVPKEPTIPVPEIPLRKAQAKSAPAAAAEPARPEKNKAARRSPAKGRYAGGVARRDQVICVILGVLVVCLGLYIGYRFLRPHLPGGGQNGTTSPPASETVPCTGVTVDETLLFAQKGQSQMLQVTLDPAGTTDSLQFSSDNPQVATVSSEGRVEAVGTGRATITVTCGQAGATCAVTCEWTEEQTTQPEQTPEETGEETVGRLSLSQTDVTFFHAGETVLLTAGSLEGSRLQWSSGDETVATVQDGLVTAVGPGTVQIRAVYQEQELTCVVRCSFEAPADGAAVISHTDVTLSVDESFTLRLRDGDGQPLEVTWSTGDSSVCTVDGNTVTAVGPGYTEVTTTYEGAVYTCVVRVN